MINSPQLYGKDGSSGFGTGSVRNEIRPQHNQGNGMQPLRSRARSGHWRAPLSLQATSLPRGEPRGQPSLVTMGCPGGGGLPRVESKGG